ncbi:MAG TPA: ABC transporter substrate-binding protein [Thermodesulfobacteriota bacterium]|nr:ABC transporter substrate-binding protein [Thermodesulfobacteriota bacterium]
MRARSSIPGRLALAFAVLAAATLAAVPGARAAETPRAGGELTFVVTSEPPSYDGHRENSYALLHPVAPHYSTLLRFDTANYPKIVGDLAESWSVSRDGLTYTFKLHEGITFHDGSPLTSADVKASYERIINPPPGVVSARKAAYQAIERIDTPDARTVIFRLKYPQASMLANFASPWNFIYPAKKLKEDPRWPEKNILGSGPFVFVEHVPGSHWVGKRYPNYFVKGRPYLDGYRALFIRSAAAAVAAVRSGQALIEFRGFSPSQRDDLVRALGERIRVQESPWICQLTVVFNNERPPFNDARVRRALSLAIDRWRGSEALSKIAIVKPVGALMRPGDEMAATEAELTQLPGFSRNIEASRAEARRLLKEAGVPEGFRFVFKNRDVQMPYEPVAVFLVDQWRSIGVNAEHRPLETAQFLGDLRTGNYEVSMDFACDFMDDPDLQLVKYISSDKSPQNFARYIDRTLDDLYERQSRAINPAERRRLVREFERRVLEQAYQVPTIWWQRIVPHWTKVRGWYITPSHYVGQDLRDVWLAE